MKIVLLILAIIATIAGAWVLDDFEGEDSLVLGMVLVVLGVFFGLMALMSFPPM